MDDVPLETKKRRLAEIVEIQYQLSLQNNLADIGKTFEVLVEKTSKKSDDEWCGRNQQNKVIIFPKGNHQTLITLSAKELQDLTAVFHQVVRRMDMNFQIDFPYVMSIMQAPVDGGSYSDFRMHLWLQPPYRQPGLIKYLAGPEIGAGNFMADTMPEDKAAELLKVNLGNYVLER